MEDKYCKICGTRSDSLFKCVNDENFEQIINCKIVRKIKKREHLFLEGDKSMGFYCLRSGSVRSYKTSMSGKEQTFQIYGKGGWIGFRDSISSDYYNHNAICLEDGEVCFIEKNVVLSLMKVDSTFQIEIMKYLANEWKQMENHIHSMGTKQVHSKLAEMLITFKNASGNESDISLKMTREVMASYIGTTTESLIRALSDLKDRNIIKIDKNRIELTNPEALYSLSEIVENK